MRVYKMCVYTVSSKKHVVFADMFSVLTYYIIVSRSSSIVKKNISI